MTTGGLCRAGWRRLEQQAAICIAIVALRAGHPAIVAVLGELCGVSDVHQLGTMAALLLIGTQKRLNSIMRARQPTAYLGCAVRRQIAGGSHQEPQKRMVEIDSSDYAGDPLDVVHGIDPVQYVAALRASGRTRDLRLADSIEAYYCDDARKQDVGDADYQQMLDFFDSRRAKSIGRRTMRWYTRPGVGGGVLAQPNWVRTTGTKDDSVWHAGCLHLLEKKSSQMPSTGQL